MWGRSVGSMKDLGLHVACRLYIHVHRVYRYIASIDVVHNGNIYIVSMVFELCVMKKKEERRRRKKKKEEEGRRRRKKKKKEG